MARLSDVRQIYRNVGIIPFFLRVYDEMNKDNLWVWASALAYSWLFAIFPFFIFLLALLPYLPEKTRDKARVEIKAIVIDRLPSVAGSVIWKDIEHNPANMLHQKTITTPVLIAGLLIALFAASGGTAMTMSALDRCYELEHGRNFIVHRLLAIGLTIIVAIMLLAVICLLPIATIVKHWMIDRGMIADHAPLILFDVARWAVSLLLMVLVLTLVYYAGPAIRHRFCFISPGAVFVVVVWVILGLVFKFYVDRIGAAGYNRTYGTVGGVAILLFFFYIDALVLLIGGEINSEVDFEVLRVRRGQRDFRHAEDIAGGAPTDC